MASEVALDLFEEVEAGYAGVEGDIVANEGKGLLADEAGVNAGAVANEAREVSETQSFHSMEEYNGPPIEQPPVHYDDMYDGLFNSEEYFQSSRVLTPALDVDAKEAEMQVFQQNVMSGKLIAPQRVLHGVGGMARTAAEWVGFNQVVQSYNQEQAWNRIH